LSWKIKNDQKCGNLRFGAKIVIVLATQRKLEITLTRSVENSGRFQLQIESRPCGATCSNDQVYAVSIEIGYSCDITSPGSNSLHIDARKSFLSILRR